MNRLLQLQQHFISSDPNKFFREYKAKSTIQVDEFKKVVYGPNYEERDKALKLIKDNPTIFQHFHITQANRDSQRQVTSRQFMFLTPRLRESAIQGSANPNKFTLFGNGFTCFDLNIVTKLGVHYSLYLKIIQRLSTTQLHRYYYERACNFQDFGCFALTQLMHGSNVKGLLTEAHYDHTTKQLIIHTPSKYAIKFWIGGSAKTSNMCAVWAQLYLNGKCYGVHAIIVPLRDNLTQNVLPGITIGDCGPKFGLNGIDNGFIEFNKFRVPVGNLLNKVSGINQKGQFFNTVQSQNKRFGMTLAALSQGRFYMCCHSTTLGLSALAIALRYTFVRSQFSKKAGGKQSFLIQYPLTKRRMVPLLAMQVVYMCTTMNAFYTAENNQDKNTLSPSNPLLKQVHAISSVLKSKTAWAATEVIRECRQMMGGHGYSAYSKMSALYGNNDVNNTWEGENNVLIQQTTKFVIQNYQKAMTGKAVQSPLLKYFQNPPQEQNVQINRQFLIDFQKIKKRLMVTVFTKVQELGAKMINLKGQQMPSTDIWNSSQVYLGHTLALATGDLYILDLCLNKLKQIKDQKTRAVFENIIHLWSLVALKADQTIDERHHAIIQRTISEYCQLLMPQILGILQAVMAGEEVLGSPFANENGQGFTKYMNQVLRQPRKQRADYWEMVAHR